MSDITITLSHDEALVFFDWLSREDGKDSIPTEHQAELDVLWRIEAQLDKVLREPFQGHYRDEVSAARERIAPKP